MNIICEVDCSRQVLEPNWVYNQDIPRKRKPLCNFCVRSFHNFHYPLQVEDGAIEVKGGRGEWLAVWTTSSSSIWTQRPGQKKPECWASGQSGVYLPRTGKPVFFQQTSWSALEGFKLKNGELREIVGGREHESDCCGGLSGMSQKGAIWHLVIDS